MLIIKVKAMKLAWEYHCKKLSLTFKTLIVFNNKMKTYEIA